MSKERLGNYFEDFHLGMQLRHATPRTLTEGDRSLYIALTGSRNAVTSAETCAHAIGFERRPLDDLLVFNTAFGKTVPDISLNGVANLGYADLRFLAPVYSGDTLLVASEVIGLRENSSGKSGIVYVRSSARNQEGCEVLSWVRWVMVHKRQPGPPTVAETVPELMSFVAPGRLRVSHFGPQSIAIRESTGCAELWQDYAIGERINHHCGMTINDSDHSLATRLYQNTAKAHFDAHLMAATPVGTRLVYGGHIISLCRALSYDGLENVLSILAINGGRHVSPTYAGDTVMCASRVIDRFELGSPHVAGLRLRLVGAKNVDSPAEIPLTDGVAEHPGVVLDLDYTVAIPKHPY